MLDLGEGVPLIPILLGFSALPILVSTTLNARVQRHNEGVALAAHVQRWQLEQLVPKRG